MQIHRPDAAMGFSQFPGRQGAAIPRVANHDVGRSDRSDRAWRPGRRRHGDDADGPLEIRADLVVGCDGRASTVRAASGLVVQDLGSPIDVLWFRLSKKSR